MAAFSPSNAPVAVIAEVAGVVPAVDVVRQLAPLLEERHLVNVRRRAGRVLEVAVLVDVRVVSLHKSGVAARRGALFRVIVRVVVASAEAEADAHVVVRSCVVRGDFSRPSTLS